MGLGLQCLFILMMFCSVWQMAYSCKNEVVAYDTTCPTNCSQNTPRITDDNVFFNCSVGGQEDVDRYRRTHKQAFLTESVIFDAPKIDGIELYWKSIDAIKEAALKLTFSLPKGVVVGSWRLPNAVLLRFQSIPGKFEDCYYVNSSRTKIFQFHFHPINGYDMLNPRQLTYDCFVGLDVLKEKLVYNISLQTAEGKMASYITTVVVKLPDRRRWYPIVMTHLNDSDGTLNVVVEKPPEIDNVRLYNVSLVDRRNEIVRSSKIKVHKTNSTKFRNLTRGHYRIKVVPVCNGGCNVKYSVTTESYIIDASVLPGDPSDSPHYLEESLEPMKVIAMVIGCIFGVMLVLTITYCIRRQHKCKVKHPGLRSNGVLLHPYPTECGITKTLRQYITNACNCTVTDCLRHHPGTKHIPIITSDKVEKCLKDSTFVLVLYTSNCYNCNATSFQTDFYSCYLNRAIARSKRHNDIRIIPLELPFNVGSDLPSVISENSIMSINLLSDPNKVYRKIHGLNNTSVNSGDLLRENNSQWRHIWSDLVQAFSQVQNNTGNIQESEPLLDDSRIAGINKELKHNYQKENGHKFVQELRNFNIENDSMLGGFRDSLKSVPKPLELDENVVTHEAEERKHIITNTNSAGYNDEQMLESHVEKSGQLGRQLYDTCKDSNEQTFEADVHYSGEENGRSISSKSRKPVSVRNEDQQMYVPTERAQNQLLYNGKQCLPHRTFDSENHEHFYQKVKSSDVRNEFIPVLNFIVENSNMEGGLFGDTEVEHITNREEHASVADTYHRPLMLHGNLQQSPNVIQHGVLARRNTSQSENTRYIGNSSVEHRPEYFDKPNSHCTREGKTAGGFIHTERQNSIHIPHISLEMPCNQNRSYRRSPHYHQNDFITGEMSSEGSYRTNHKHLPDSAQHYHIDQNNHFHQGHQNGLEHPAKHTNEVDHGSMSPARNDVCYMLHTNQCPSQPRINFNAVDPHLAKLEDFAPTVEVNKKSDEVKGNADSLLNRGSVRSLPSDLNGGIVFEKDEYKRFCAPEDFRYDSPAPSHGSQEGWRSQIMDEFVEINRNNT